MSLVEDEYRKRIDAMSVPEKMAQVEAMFRWSRELLARQLRKEHPQASDERIKWLVARRVYSGEDAVVKLIDEMLARVPD